MRKAGIVAVDEEMSADEASEGLAALNAMLHGWKAKSCDVEHTTLEIEDDFALSVEFEEPTIILLADKLAVDYGAIIPPVVQVTEAWDMVRAAYLSVTTSTFDAALVYPPSRRVRDGTLPASE